MFTYGRSFISFLPLYIPFLKALKQSGYFFFKWENIKIVREPRCGIDEHTCTCSLYLIYFVF